MARLVVDLSNVQRHNSLFGRIAMSLITTIALFNLNKASRAPLPTLEDFRGYVDDMLQCDFVLLTEY